MQPTEEIVRRVTDRAGVGDPLRVVAVVLVACAELEFEARRRPNDHVRPYAPEQRASIVGNGVDRRDLRRHATLRIGGHAHERVVAR